MNDFIRLRRDIYLGMDRTSYDSCVEYNTLLFNALITEQDRNTDFFRACIQIRALLDMDSPPPDYLSELATHRGKSGAYNSFYQDYHNLTRRKLKPADFNNPALTELVRNETILSFLGSAEKPIVLFQYLFHGDPGDVGSGNSGGAATFVRNLGNALARLMDIRGVVTMVPAGMDNQKRSTELTEYLGSEHLLLRIPFGFPAGDASIFGENQDLLAQSLLQLFTLLPRHPDLIHLRFLDAASLSTARAAKSLSIPVILTLTPDPHRTICSASGSIKKHSLAKGLEILYKIYAGDVLADLSDGLVGIGRRSLQNELIYYFPQLENTKSYNVKTIDEGIETKLDHPQTDPLPLFYDTGNPYHLGREHASRPVILNVGRLRPVKGQQNLVTAWGNSRIWEFYNLVLIGGDSENPDTEESAFFDFLSAFMNQRPHLIGRLAHLPAQPNNLIRGIEKTLAAKKGGAYPNVYVCSSLKEEFGIAVLEAMQAEMVVCAPIRGGAGIYIQHQVNGFLIDTSNAESIASEITAYFIEEKSAKINFNKIRRNAGETVNKKYSIEKISESYCSFYKEVLSETD